MMARSQDVVSGAYRRAVATISRSLAVHSVPWMIVGLRILVMFEWKQVLTIELDVNGAISAQESPHGAGIMVDKLVEGVFGGMYSGTWTFTAIKIDFENFTLSC